MLRSTFIIFLILFGIIGQANNSAISYSKEHHKFENTILKTKSQDSKEVQFSSEDRYIETEDEDQNSHKKNSNYNQASKQEFLFLDATISLAQIQFDNKYYYTKQFIGNPLYIQYANFRI